MAEDPLPILPNFSASDDPPMVVPLFDGAAAAVAEQEQARMRGEPNLAAPAYPPVTEFSRPERGRSFGETFRGAMGAGSLAGAAGGLIDAATVQGKPRLGDTELPRETLLAMPASLRRQYRERREMTPDARSQADAEARSQALDRIAEQIAYDMSKAEFTPSSIAGNVAAAAVSPENWINAPARVVGPVMQAAGRVLGPLASRIIGSGVDAAIMNTAVDPAVQGVRMLSGAQGEYDVAQTALAPVVGFAGGAALRGAIEAPVAMRGAGEAAGGRSVSEAVDVAARAESPSVTPAANPVDSPRLGNAPEVAQVAPVSRDGEVLRQADAKAPDRLSAQVAPKVPEARNANNVSDVTLTSRDVTGDVQPLERGQRPQTMDPDRRFPERRELQGEDSVPRQAVTPDEARDFRVTTEMRRIADEMGRKVEVDGRFTARNAEGEYKLKDGTIRIRADGDFQTFAHEMGHAVDQTLRASPAARDFVAAVSRHADELKALDEVRAGTPDKQRADEGVAEFLRLLVTNPAYAEKQAPRFAADFSRVLEKAPEVERIIQDAARVSSIDSGLDPVQAARSTIADALEPRGLDRVRSDVRAYGAAESLELWASRIYAAVVGGEGHWASKLASRLKGARFRKLGRPMGEFEGVDAALNFRMLPGAEQAATDSFFSGVRRYGLQGAIDPPVSPSIKAALETAGNGNYLSMTTSPDRMRDFDTYLMLRRARALYERRARGELLNQPVRLSQNEVGRGIQQMEAADPQFREAADMVFAYSRAFLDRIHDAGILPTKVRDAIAARNEDYVPFHRDMLDNRPAGGGGDATGAGGADIKRLKGSTRDIKGPLASLMMDVARYERIIAENDMRLAFVKLAQSGGEFSGRFIERVPNTEIKAQSVDLAEAIRQGMRQAGRDANEAEVIIRSLEEMVGVDPSATIYRAQEVTPSGDRLWFTWEGGERTAWKIGTDPWAASFYDAMVQMSSRERDALTEMMGGLNGFFSQMITNAPQFALGNLIADGMTRPFVAKHVGLLGRVPLSGMARGVYNTIIKREVMKAIAPVAQPFEANLGRTYSAMGGIRGGPASASVRELRSEGARVLEMAPRGFIDATAEIARLASRGKLGQASSTLLRRWVSFMESTETIGRIGQTALVFDHLKKQGLDDATAMRAAVFQARDLLDYDRRGTVMAGWRRLQPFLNPGIQGTDLALRRMIGEPMTAAVHAYQRGGWDKLDGEHKTALRNAVKVWGTVAAGIVATLAYQSAVWDDPVYRRRSEWMRKQYFNFPLSEGRAADGSDDWVLSIRKPFDLPGRIMTAVEQASDGIRRADPEGWTRVMNSLREGFIPRQFEGLDGLAQSSPFIRALYEVKLGRTLGMDGAPSRDLIPMGLQNAQPRDQFTARTSTFAKKLGELTGQSPIVIDHLIGSLTATAGRDTSDAVTGIFGNNPQMTAGDAFTKAFLGNVLRRQQGIGQAANDLLALMSGSQSKYGSAAESYRLAVRDGEQDRMRSIFSNSDGIGQSLMILRAYGFEPPEKQLHPLERSQSFLRVISGATRQLAANYLEVQDRGRIRGQQRDTIDVQPADARALINVLNAWGWEEVNNGLKVAGVPGYGNYPTIDTAARMAMIRKLSPAIADEIQTRIDKAHILPLETVARAWPEVQRRLLASHDAADLSDLLSGTAARRARRGGTRRQRAREANEDE